MEAGNQEDGFESQLVRLDVGAWRPGRCEEVGEALDSESGIGRLVAVSRVYPFILRLTHSILGCKTSLWEKEGAKEGSRLWCQW